MTVGVWCVLHGCTCVLCVCVSVCVCCMTEAGISLYPALFPIRCVCVLCECVSVCVLD